MQTVMVQFRYAGSPPSLDDVRQMYGLDAEEIDVEFGVIATDPEEGLYTILVSVGASERVRDILEARSEDPAEGVFSNPKVEPFGTPKR